METKIDLILSELIKVNTRLAAHENRFDSLESKVDGVMRAFYVFKNSTDANFKDLFELNRYTGQFLQGHEDRLVALEAVA